MKKIIVLLLLSLSAFSAGAADLKTADRLLNAGSYDAAFTELESCLAEAAPPAARSEALWRLARLCAVRGSQVARKQEKLAVFEKGADYAARGVKETPDKAACHMWHCANVGYACQLKSTKDMIAAVPVMTGDLTTILDRLGRTNCSEAWQALSEIYWRHPFKSDDAAVNFARKAAMTIPSSELRLTTYAYFANLLIKRDNSAAKRKSAALSGASKLKSAKGNIGRCEYLDASLGADYVPVWDTRTLGEMSDRQEAAAIIEYALKLSKSKPSIPAAERPVLKELNNMKSQLK
ncbi:MAG: hypothetical protein MJY57_01330 [Bacteroidales bacterium]|nr:hypothetical protein [Bacteroidales bacterium]